MKRLAGQFLRFVLIGLVSTLIDAIVYRIALTAVSIELAKAAGYLAGMTFSITCNYRWTFGYKGDGRAGIVARCVALYATALVLNVAANRLALTALPRSDLSLPIAFLFAVGVSTIYNFAGMRFWIFRRVQAA